MKRKIKKALSTLLVLCMVIGLLPCMAVTAAAADTPAASVIVNGNVTLDSSKPYLVNGKAAASGTLGSDGCTAYYNAGTLTLKGYNGGTISARGRSDARISLTVEVDGANTITATGGYGINCMYGDLTIVGKNGKSGSDALTVTSTSACVEAYQGDMTIQDLASLELSCTGEGSKSAVSINNGAYSIAFSNMGSVKISSTADSSTVFNRQGDITFNQIDALEIIGKNNAISTMGDDKSASITNCGNVTLYSEKAAALYTYDSTITVTADRLVALGGTYGIQQHRSTRSVDVTAETIYIRGGTKAVVGKSDSVTVKTSESAEPISVGDEALVSSAAGGAAGEATISITTSKSYDGQPFDPAPSAVDSASNELTGMSYLYSWYDSTGSTRLSTAPTDAGTYKLTVYGYNNTHAGTLEKQTITINRATVPAAYVKSVSADIAKGYNVIALPELPSGMKFGAITGDGTLENLTIAGNLLSFQATENCSSDTDRTVTIEVPAGGNYSEYTITLTLKQLANQAIFDRCDGSEPSKVTIGTDQLPDTTLYSAEAGRENLDGAWQAAIGEADMYGYEFAGWYTAPNGWGDQIAKADGTLVEGKSFSAGTTYYAKWVWTIGNVGAEAENDDYYSAYLVFGKLEKPRTVYTTCLDFTKSAPNEGDGYKWENNNKTLTLDGVHIQALDSVCGIILPAGSTIEVVSLTDNSYNNFYKYKVEHEDQKDSATGYTGYSKASNIISCGSVDATADVFCLGNLTIHSDATNAETNKEVGLGNWLNAKQGGIRTAANGTHKGTLTVKNANIDTTRLRADGDITVDDSLIFATNFSSTFTGDRYVRSYNGSVTIQDGWVFTEWLQAATNLSISGKESRIRASFGASAGEKITISNSGYKNASGDNFALDFGNEENTLWGLCANNIEISGSLLNSASIMTEGTLTVSGGSEVNAHSSQMALPICIYGGGSISNSKVNVTEVDSGSVGIYSTAPLTINSSTVTVTKASEEATPAAAILVIAPKTGTGLALNSEVITAPSGATVKKLSPSDAEETALWFIVKSDKTSIADEVTIVPAPRNTSSGSSSPASYPVAVPSATEGGSVSVSPKSAAKGKPVTITATPDEGYVLDSLTVTDSSGKVLTLTAQKDGKYTFTMPAGKVSISATFKEKTPTPAYDSFTDLTENAWYQDGVRYVLDNGLMVGVTGEKFVPGGTTSRAMVVTVLWRLAGKPQTGTGSAFTDVPAGNWCSDAVAWAAELGITNGYGDTFNPNGSITREQLAAMLYRFAKSQGKGFTGTWMMDLDYPDADGVSDWAYEALCWMTMNGVVNGRSSGLLDPHGQATRAEVAVMLARFAGTMQ